MLDQPLKAFSWPTTLPQVLPSGLSAGVITLWVLYAVFICWAIYTLVAIYHWLKYSHASWLAFPAIAMHLAISFALISYVLSGSGSFLAPYLP